jgi:beta-glucanase (GH16 family)
MITKIKKYLNGAGLIYAPKFTKRKGIWPAMWMLGNNIDAVNWPACGEIDILECLGHENQ